MRRAARLGGAAEADGCDGQLEPTDRTELRLDRWSRREAAGTPLQSVIGQVEMSGDFREV